MATNIGLEVMGELLPMNQKYKHHTITISSIETPNGFYNSI